MATTRPDTRLLWVQGIGVVATLAAVVWGLVVAVGAVFAYSTCDEHGLGDFLRLKSLLLAGYVPVPGVPAAFGAVSSRLGGRPTPWYGVAVGLAVPAVPLVAFGWPC
jgi:hypothetical protein